MAGVAEAHAPERALERGSIITAVRSTTDIAPPEAVFPLGLDRSTDRPVHIRWGDSPLLRPAPLVELFTSAEQRARTSTGYVLSAVGARLRLLGIEEHPGRVIVEQIDELTGIMVATEIRTTVSTAGESAWRVVQRIRNSGDAAVVLTAPIGASVGIGHGQADLDAVRLVHADSEWLAEGRWRTEDLRAVLPELNLAAHGQDARGRFSRASSGGWSTGRALPVGVLVDAASGHAVAWQIESSSGWVWELTQGRAGATLALCGPTDAEHAFSHRLAPGAMFETVPVVVAVSSAGRDGAFAALTRARRAERAWGAADRALPVVYNDYMNTLKGDPTVDRVRPLIAAAADAGAEVFCMDAGWFAPAALGADWWSTVGAWRESADRYPGGGLRAVCEEIHAAGMASGLWLEPEVIGVDSPLARTLPDDAFLQRGGIRVTEDRRYHLDFRHPAAREHLDVTVDHLVSAYGIAYLKLDYNIDPGPGTDVAANGPGDGLLGHVRAYRQWVLGLRHRHPRLLIENCASGAMRMDYALVGVVHQQSTSDQQDAIRYAPIAASAPAALAPEQAANWAYPSREMSDEETAFTLANALAGRLCLSGFLGELRDRQRDLVREAIALHRRLRPLLADAVPSWPLGMPRWDDDVLALGLHASDGDVFVVWNRSAAPAEVIVPAARSEVIDVFPWETARGASPRDGALVVRLPAGPSARVVRLGPVGGAASPAGRHVPAR